MKKKEKRIVYICIQKLNVAVCKWTTMEIERVRTKCLWEEKKKLFQIREKYLKKQGKDRKQEW